MRQIKISSKEVEANSKKAVIEKLIAYRLVFAGLRRNDPEPTMQFNAALSSIPVHLSNNKERVDNYRAIGSDFISEKYYTLITSIMNDVPLGVDALDKHLLENVPHATPKTH